MTFQIKYWKKECHFVQNKHIYYCIDGKQQHNWPLIIFLLVFYLIFVFELFSRGHSVTLWWWNNSPKRKVELYLGSMESKHTTRLTRKQWAKKIINRRVYILTDFAIGSLVIILDTISLGTGVRASGEFAHTHIHYLSWNFCRLKNSLADCKSFPADSNIIKVSKYSIYNKF